MRFFGTAALAFSLVLLLSICPCAMAENESEPEAPAPVSAGDDIGLPAPDADMGAADLSAPQPGLEPISEAPPLERRAPVLPNSSVTINQKVIDDDLAEKEEQGFSFTKMGGQVKEYYNKGGPVMHVLLICSILSLTFIIWKFIDFVMAGKNSAAFLEKVKAVVAGDSADRIKRGMQVCEKYPGPAASIIAAGLTKFDRGREMVIKAIEEAGGVEMSRLERGLVVLATIANIAPLIGFLGTVTGMIKSFDVIAKAGLNNPGLVAVGISEALITTATGLIIAIPTFAAYNYFTTRVSRLVLDMEESSNVVIDHLYDA